MDDSITQSAHNTPSEKQSSPRIPLGMSSFGAKEQHELGRNLRLAMACIEGSSEPLNTKAMPSNANDIRHRLQVLAQDITSHHADLLELLVRFDELEGWKSSGAKHCSAWMNLELGYSPTQAWDYLRVGRKLRTLPTTQALFRAGKLSWSKVRLIVSVADADNEKTLCHAALDASVTEVKRLCEGYRWGDDDQAEEQENARVVKQWQSRSLTWQETSIGSTRIQIVLPQELAQAFLNSVEYSLGHLDEHNELDESTKNDTENNETNMSQRRADAAILMAEANLQQASREVATGDRFQVILSADVKDVAAPTPASESTGTGTGTSTSTPPHDNELAHEHEPSPSAPCSHSPSKRPTIKGAGPVARETARRLACDCSLSSHITSEGEPVDIGRKSRIWPSAMSRAIKARDQHCQFPGCSRSHHLHIHHISHWADGGSTSISNGICLCGYHHLLVHEGGYTIEHASSSEQLINAQFEQQRHTHDKSLFDFERDLRNDKASFDRVRQLSPTRFRFRFKNTQGVDVRALSYGSIDNNDESETKHVFSTELDGFTESNQYGHSTRVKCGEPEHRKYTVALANPAYYKVRNQ